MKIKKFIKTLIALDKLNQEFNQELNAEIKRLRAQVKEEDSNTFACSIQNGKELIIVVLRFLHLYPTSFQEVIRTETQPQNTLCVKCIT